MLLHYRVLFYIASVAAGAIALDSLLESGILTSQRHPDSRLARALALLWKTHSSASVSTALPRPNPIHVREQYVALPIDHGNISAGTFLNRYWITTDRYAPGGPIIVHDVGEIGAESSSKKFLGQPSSYLQQLLNEFHGIGIVWEHRYYGKSLPFALNQDDQVDMLRFLNLDQSLADLPHFASTFSLPSSIDVDLTPVSTPWIMVGCSYSGLRAAVSRSRYPETFYAAYAASAPVQLQVEFNMFFDPIYEKLVDCGYSDCAHDLHEMMLYLDDLLSSTRDVSRVKQQILGPGAEVNSNGDFTLAVANIYSYFQSHGLEGGPHSLRSLCDYLGSDKMFNRTAQGTQDSSNHSRAQRTLAKLTRWPDLVRIVNSHFNTTCAGPNAAAAAAVTCDLGKPATDTDSISWTWQLCSELGLFPTQNLGDRSLVSQYQSLEYRQSLCRRQFPRAVATKLLSAAPTAEFIVQQTGGRMMRPSNVFWTAGQYDPWRALTPLAADETDAVTFSQQVPPANVSTGPDMVFGLVLEDGQHCSDYDVEAEQAAIAQSLFASALREWLPAFEGSQS